MARPKVNKVWASSNPALRRDPGDAKYITGWVSEIPTFQVLNYLQWKNDTTFLALAERGIFEWGGDVAYYINALAWDPNDGKVYVTSVNNPRADTPPSKNPNQWQLSAASISRNDYDIAKAAWSAHIANMSNPHKLTAGQLNAYTQAETAALIDSYRKMVSDHANDTNNPHKTKAVDIGAVPVTGGSYTGDVTFATGRIKFDDAGTATVSRDNTGVWLTNGVGRLGLGSGTVITPMAGTTSGLYPIVTAKDFATYKAQFEGRYAVPNPVWALQAQWNVNLQFGQGTMTSTNWINHPAYTSPYATADGALILSMQKTQQTLNGSVNPLKGKVNCTFALSFRYAKPADPNSTENNKLVGGLGIGSNQNYFGMRFADGPNRGVWWTGNGVPNSPTIVVKDTAAHTMIVRRNGAAITVWLDGVVVQTGTMNTVPIDNDNMAIYVNNNVGAGFDPAKYNDYVLTWNYRVWDVALTDEQVSTL